MKPRREFLRNAASLAAILAVPALGAQTAAPGAPATPASPPAVPKRPPPLAAELVKEFVGAAHGDLAKTQALLAAHPGLINATWDWGGGDFETALGGAAHMGRRDIAEFLLAQGARPDVFALAMLGHLEAVQAIIAARPEARLCPGPHRIPLIAHARKGGAEANAVVEFLERLAAAG